MQFHCFNAHSGGKRLSLSESLTVHSTTRSKTLIHSNKYLMKSTVEIILTLNATFKCSADQQIYMTWPEGQTQVIVQEQSISLIRCLFRLVKCKSTVWASVQISMVHIMVSLPTYLIFSTHARSVKQEGLYIYIYAFSRRFYPKWLTVHSGYTCFVCVFPGN